MRDSSSPALSSPPSGSISDPGSPLIGRPNNNDMDMDEIIVDPSQPRFGVAAGDQPPQPEVRLTAAGLPRKKPGRKPGSTVKPKNPDEPPKVRRPRKPRDPNAPPIQRKRKSAPAADADAGSDSKSLAAAAASSSTPPPSRQTKITDLVGISSPSRPGSAQPEHTAQKAPKREEMPRSMQSILNADPEPEPKPQNTVLPTRTSGQGYDPIRGSYDPVRGIFGSASSPRPATQTVNRPSASPSIASLVDPPTQSVTSPSAQNFRIASTAQSRTENASLPASPSYPARSIPQAISKPPAPEPKKALAPPPVPAIKADAKLKDAASTAGSVASKKHSPKQKPQKSGVSSPKLNALDDSRDLLGDRSILDFGRAETGKEYKAPDIVLDIPIKPGDTNIYINVMRMAEEKYGWDALHPRLAEKRDRKARIAAASAALEKTASGQESGDEMSEDSDKEASNVEMGGMTSGADLPEKPKKKKRNFKEDEYDKDDDFVDDSELLWEQQAAASRDGFFVYSGPLVPEVEKPADTRPDGLPKRGRGSRGGRIGGRGGTTRGEGGTGRGGGPGSRGGRGSRGGSLTRKPRITKSEKEQLEREKADRQRQAELSAKSTNGYSLQPQTPSFAAGMAGA
ncbi:histone promoter control 2 [Colletotrichum tamarilloi]|uniref:Histone promoter control 2 n=1 Tax=Colletotrichum tamarilloi TaxID=1209934 RepID=A0ABQ9RI18_9PEZI|nr:histone promoter control 2 [Colletotrichum tamarilloi]KAK1503510.1 histone promoter control 2 [Colletotrichum tamarilloi]